LYAAKHKYLENVEVEQVNAFEEGLMNYVHSEYPNVFDRIETEKALDESLEQQMRTAIEAYLKVFTMSEGA
jgi:F-type H+-transporting ATPase subunit alpha